MSDIKKNTAMRTARVERGMSQADLADAVNATRQTIGLIETGRYNPSLKLCTAICKALGKTLNDLFWEQEAHNVSDQKMERIHGAERRAP